MRKLILLLALGVPLFLQAQTDEEALRYSTTETGGTARYMGAGGAFGALGGDFSVLSTNPGGLGLYRGSEFVFTPSLYSSNTVSSFFDEAHQESKYNFNFNNLGAVFSKMYMDSKGKPRTNGWVAVNFGIGYNRMANFHNTTFISGYNPENSLLDRYLEKVNSGGGTFPGQVYNENPFDAGLAYFGYLINPLSGDSLQYSSVIPDGEVQQTKVIQAKGALDETVLSVAGNYENRLYVGLTIGIPSIEYEQSVRYTEEDIYNNIDDFASFSQFDYLKTEGRGINLKVGMIYRITENLRVGGAVHSPTRYWMNDRYYSSLESDLETSTHEDIESPDGRFDYSLTTPWKLIGSAAYLIGKHGFVSVDYEWMDKGLASFSFPDEPGTAEKTNEQINAKYSPVSVIRVGTEWNIHKFKVRGGFNYQSTPFDESIGQQDYARLGWSLGAGLRTEGYFVDLAWVRNSHSEFHVPYTLNDPSETVGGAVIDKKNTSLLLSLGLRF